MAIENRMRELLNDVDREQHEKRERESARCAGPELAPASWLDALITNLQAEIDEAGEEGMRANNDGHDKSATACFIIARTLARLRRAVERTQESASNVGDQP